MLCNWCVFSFFFPLVFPSACQCNGHSQCVNESVCEKCEDLTTGRHCESCISGFFGDPTNGGSCQRESITDCHSVKVSEKTVSFVVSLSLSLSQL